MNPDFSDPNNHVPEVNPGDEWGDSEALAAGSTAVLPRRRPPVEPPRRSAPAAPEDAPVRIEAKHGQFKLEPRVTRPAEPEEEPRGPVRLEVQQIDGRVIRLEQEAEVEAPPKVERLTKFEKRQSREEREQQKKQVDEQEWGTKPRSSMRWVLAGAGLVLVLIAGGLFVTWFVNEYARPPFQPEMVYEPDGSALAVAEEPQTRFLLMQPEAAQLFHAYAMARSVDEVIPLVRDGQAIAPLLRAGWQPMNLPADWPVPFDAGWEVDRINGKVVGAMTANLPGGRTTDCFMVMEDGRPRIDWKATVLYSSASLAELAKGAGDAAEIRGIVTADRFYNAVWPEAEFRCYLLSAPGSDTTLWCYASRGGPADEAIQKVLKGSQFTEEAQTRTRATLRLERGSPDSQPNQWRIADVLFLDWVNP